MENNTKWRDAEIGGLWKNIKKGKAPFLSGYASINGVKGKLMVFPNQFKSKNPNAPDYRAYFFLDDEDSKGKGRTYEKQPQRAAQKPYQKSYQKQEEGELNQDPETVF